MEKLENFFQKKKQEKPKQALEEGNNSLVSYQQQQSATKLVLISDNSGQNKLQIQSIAIPSINICFDINKSTEQLREAGKTKEGGTHLGQQQNEKNSKPQQNIQIIQNESIIGNISENVVHRKNNQQNQEEAKRLTHFTRFLLKDVDKLKLAICNIESATKGVQYLRKKIKSDKLFHRRLREKVSKLRDLI